MKSKTVCLVVGIVGMGIFSLGAKPAPSGPVVARPANGPNVRRTPSTRGITPPTIKITAFQVKAAVGDAVTYDVEVENTGKPQKVELHFVPAGGTDVTQAFESKAGKHVVEVVDKAGLVRGCENKGYDLFLSGDETDPTHRKGYASPSCKFTVTAKDDLRDSRDGRVSMSDPTNGPYTCGQPFEVISKLANRTPVNPLHLKARFADVDGSVVMETPINHLAAGASGNVRLDTPGGPIGRAGRMTVKLVDDAAELSGKIATQELDFDVARQCTYSARLAAD